MSKTERRKAWNLFSRERKPFRKRHQKAYRHSVNTAVREIAATSNTGNVEVPRYRRTSGWLTW